MSAVLRSLFALILAAAISLAVSACNTNGGIPALVGPPAGGGATPSPTSSPPASVAPSRSPSPSPSPTPT